MAAYAKSRGERLTRPELRRRVAAIAGGPALLRTSKSFGALRHQTQTLFALLDEDEDGVISSDERDNAIDTLSDQDEDENGQLTMAELRAGLKPRSARRDSGSNTVQWKSWDANKSEHTEDLCVQVSFSDDAEKSNLKIDKSRLNEPWNLMKVNVRRAKETKSPSPIVMLSHPDVAVTLSAVKSNAREDRNSDQISIGATLEPNALFRTLDQDGNGILSAAECRSCDDAIVPQCLNLPTGRLRNAQPSGTRVVHQHGQRRRSDANSERVSGTTRII